MENLSPEEGLRDTSHEETPTNEEETNETSQESVEPKLDHWEMASIMRKHGFTDVNEHPLITNDPRIKEMRDQDFTYGSDTNDKGETTTTIWKDGYCWARKGSHPQLEEIEKAIGHTLRSGALQPANLEFDHRNLE